MEAGTPFNAGKRIKGHHLNQSRNAVLPLIPKSFISSVKMRVYHFSQEPVQPWEQTI